MPKLHPPNLTTSAFYDIAQGRLSFYAAELRQEIQFKQRTFSMLPDADMQQVATEYIERLQEAAALLEAPLRGKGNG